MKKVFFPGGVGLTYIIMQMREEGEGVWGVGYPLWVNGWVPYLGPYEEGGSQTEGVLLSFLPDVNVLHDSIPNLPGHR